MPIDFSSQFITAPALTTLAWDGDELLNVASGLTIHADGTRTNRSFYLGFPFDRGLSARSHDALWTIAYQNRGTKAVLLKNHQVHRELNRSFNCATEFDYPISISSLPSGRAAIFHCPNSYNVIECEDAETGKILWTRESTHMEFHSRLAVSENAEYLISAGWFWHPVGGLWLCPLPDTRGKSNSSHEVGFSFGAEIDSAAFLGNDLLAVASSQEVIDHEIPENGLPPLTLAVWSIRDGKWLSTVSLDQPAGTIMPWHQWVVSFYDHPKLIELATGRILHVWEYLQTGRQVGSIDLGNPPPPAIAINPQRGKFAVSDSEGVTIVTFTHLT